MNKPNLFIVGAPKAGSSFLFENLRKHPLIWFPRVKEVNFFSSHDIEQSGSYYKDYKITDVNKYLNFFQPPSNCKYCVDSSVSYFTYIKVPEKIREFEPNAKIIITLRNPIKRAFSHFRMDVRMGYADKDNFLEYIENPDKHQAHYRQYILNSTYSDHIQRYIDIFGENNVHVLLLEEIEKQFQGLLDFLEIENDQIQIDFQQKINKNKSPRNIISRILQRNRKLTSYLKLIVPIKIIKKYNEYLYKPDESTSINDHEYEIVRNILLKDIQKLSILLNRDMVSFWEIN
jgi:hypothetical protein